MPNWCSTHYIIKSNDYSIISLIKQDLKTVIDLKLNDWIGLLTIIHSSFKDKFLKFIKENGGNEDALYKFYEEGGLTKKEKKEYDRITCDSRAFIEDYDVSYSDGNSPSEIKIYSEDAWTSKIDFVVRYLKKILNVWDKVTLDIWAEETGFLYFVDTENNFKYRLYIDVSGLPKDAAEDFLSKFPGFLDEYRNSIENNCYEFYLDAYNKEEILNTTVFKTLNEIKKYFKDHERTEGMACYLAKYYKPKNIKKHKCNE